MAAMAPEIETLLNQTVNGITVAHAAWLFVAARVGLVLLRWVGRLLTLVFYVAASGLLRFRWAVWGCAFVLTRWQVDLGHAILDLQSDHLAVQAGVSGQGDSTRPPDGQEFVPPI